MDFIMLVVIVFVFLCYSVRVLLLYFSYFVIVFTSMVSVFFVIIIPIFLQCSSTWLPKWTFKYFVLCCYSFGTFGTCYIVCIVLLKWCIVYLCDVWVVFCDVRIAMWLRLWNTSPNSNIINLFKFWYVVN